MNISNLFQDLHGTVDLNRLIPMVERPDIVPPERFQAGVKHLEIDPHDVYYDPFSKTNYCVYMSGPIYFPLYNMDMTLLKELKLKEGIDFFKNEFKRLTDKKDYLNVFRLMDKKIIISYFVDHYFEIPDHIRYDVFVDIYVRSEYGFDKFTDSIMTDLMINRYLSKNWIKRMIKLRKRMKGKPTLKIYRGQTDKSTSEETALSWTLKKKTAEFFATRFSNQGRVVQREIYWSEVMDHLNNRNEDEILVLPKLKHNNKEMIHDEKIMAV